VFVRQHYETVLLTLRGTFWGEYLKFVFGELHVESGVQDGRVPELHSNKQFVPRDELCK
jgi:hypothetical protein